MKRLHLIRLICAAVVSLVSYVRVAQAQETVFLYSVAFTCVPEVGRSVGGHFESGTYRTAINVNNLSQSIDFVMRATASGDFAGLAEERVSERITRILSAERSVVIDCEDIAKLLGGPTDFGGSGFLIIESRVELDVVAVYTSSSFGAGGPEVKYIQPRTFSTFRRAPTLPPTQP